MKTGQELYTEHLARLKTAVSLQKPDRTPVYLHAGAFAVRYAGGKLADLVTDIEYGQSLGLKGILALGDIEGSDLVEHPPIIGLASLSHSKIPGRELPDDMQWQVDERGLMTREDYDLIIEKGWNYFFTNFCKTNLGDSFDEAQRFAKYSPKIEQDYKDAGIVTFLRNIVSPPVGSFGGGRGTVKFTTDLFKIPDKVQAAMDAAMYDRINDFRQRLRTNKDPIATVTGGGRSAGDFLSPKAFDRFVWPYIKILVETAVEEGALVVLHMDLSWDRYLDYFLELPKGKCVFAPDSTTDIFKAQKVLAGHMCIMGDVSPALLTLGTPSEVYKYSKRLVDELSPTGLIMGAGCSVPMNAKPENVKAMIAAAFGS
jgi:uroporphyrinogen decarboxylase